MHPEVLEGYDNAAFTARLFEVLARVAPGFVSCIDRRRRILYLNRTLSRGTDDILGRRMEEFVAAPHRDAVIACVEDAFISRHEGHLDYSVLLNDGTRRHNSTRVVPFSGPRGEQLALMLTEDVTDRRQTLEELQRSTEFRRRVVEHLPDFVSMLDRERRFVWVNRLAPGLKFEDVIGKRLEDFGAPEGSLVAEATISAAFDSGAVGVYETEGYGNGENSATYLVRVVPVTHHGIVEHVLLISSDITEQRRAEQALRQTQEQLHQAQRLKSLGQLAGGVAHDFNNLLQVIKSNLFFARQGLEQGDPVFEELEQAQRAAERGRELTSHLLAIGRRKRVDTERVELGELVAQCVRMLRRVIPENVIVRFETPNAPYFVELDAPQFEQVLINLCVNARDAMPEGGTLTIRIEPEATTHVVVIVSDTGAGIAPENLVRVFEPFFTTKSAGSGLGLAVAAGIVGAHGGVISAESDGRRGTMMKVRLPRVAAGAEPSSPPPVRSVAGSGVVLVAEDEALVRAQLVRILEGAGYRVLQARDGVHAVDLFRAHRREIKVVVLDVVMPDLDGWQAYLRIAEMEPAARVLFTTGYAANVLPDDFAARGGRLLSKPYKPQLLLELVHQLLESAEAAAAPSVHVEHP